MLRREKASFCTFNRVKTHRPCTFLLWLQLLCAQKADSNSLFQRRLLSVKEIIMSQLERRTLPYHMLYLSPACHGKLQYGIYGFSTIQDLKKCNAAKSLFSKKLQPVDTLTLFLTELSDHKKITQ